MTTPNPYAPPTAAVQDIYDPTGPLELADRGTRLAAFIVDVIFMVLWYLPMFGSFIAVPLVGDDYAPLLAVGGVAGLIWFGIWCWLSIKYVLANGQSIAKKMLGIKVVRTDGSPASLGRIFWLRNVVNGLMGILPLYQIIDWLFIVGESRQCLHDKLADTLVVKA